MSAANMVAKKLPKVFDAKTHAVLDYLTAGAFFAMAAMFWGSNKRAAIGAGMCGSAVVATSMLTDYPGGVQRVISFETHGRIDTGLAGLTAGIPNVMAFNDEDEAKYFRGAALVETIITGLTDFDSAAGGKVVEMRTRGTA
jgi:hypothetical protein